MYDDLALFDLNRQPSVTIQIPIMMLITIIDSYFLTTVLLMILHFSLLYLAITNINTQIYKIKINALEVLKY